METRPLRSSVDLGRGTLPFGRGRRGGLGLRALGGSGRGRLDLGAAAADAVLGEDQGLDLLEHLRVLLEERARVLPALADALALEREPGAALLDDVGLGGEIEDVAAVADAL